MSRALAEFGSAVAARYGHEYPAEEVADSGVMGDLSGHEESADARYEAFRAVRDHVASKFDIDVDPNEAARLRGDVLRRTGLWPSGTQTAEVVERALGDTEQADQAERYLDAEFVAIYW